MEFENDEYVGTISGIYEIMYISGKDKYGHKIYHIKCTKCGYEKDSIYKNIYKTRNCYHVAKNGNYINYGYKFKNKRIRRILRGMKRRCYNSNSEDYYRYGARGIRICDEWLDNPVSFEEWALNNGYADNLTIDRIDENKDYCPENCRWISNEENARYKSTTHEIVVDGELHTGHEWSLILGIGRNRINTYVRKYGIDNTAEFIKRYKKNPQLKDKRKANQSLYELYMQN